jgi:hypothetical protein
LAGTIEADLMSDDPSVPTALPEGRRRRLLWIVNHKTLMRSEVSILRSIGWEVFVPKIVPDHDSGYRSASITHEYDDYLGLPSPTLAVLNNHNFYERAWSPTVATIIGDHFDALVAHFSCYTITLSEAARKFRGLVVARAFGREHPRTYSEFQEYGQRKDLLSEIASLGERFIFGQAYSNLAEVESPVLQSRAHTITVSLPDELFKHCGSWTGGGQEAIFLCPAISGLYYRSIYDRIKHHFGSLPHRIFGRQIQSVDDPAVLPWLTDEQLIQLYATAPVFAYPHTEPRHLHYSPLEAMVVGTPVLYMRGALIDQLADRANLPGACADFDEMRRKAERILAGDLSLAEAIRSAQSRVLDLFSYQVARRQWRSVLERIPHTAGPMLVVPSHQP